MFPCPFNPTHRTRHRPDTLSCSSLCSSAASVANSAWDVFNESSLEMLHHTGADRDCTCFAPKRYQRSNVDCKGSSSTAVAVIRRDRANSVRFLQRRLLCCRRAPLRHTCTAWQLQHSYAVRVGGSDLQRCETNMHRWEGRWLLSVFPRVPPLCKLLHE